MNIDAEILSKSTSRSNPTAYWKDWTPPPSGIHPRNARGWLNIENRSMKYTILDNEGEKKHIIISFDTEKAFDKTQHLILIKNTKRKNSKNRRELPQHNKGHL